MAKRDRGTLKRFFEKGALPSAEHFADLVDSSLNIRDDGFSKTPKDGLQLSSLDNQNALLSLYQRVDFDNPIWSIRFGEEGKDNLTFCSEHHKQDRRTVLTMHPLGRVGINIPTPTVALDVDGTAMFDATQGRECKPVMADGKWYDVTEGLEGCYCFELVAGVGVPNSGMYAMLHCTALGIFEQNPSWWSFLWRSSGFKKQQRYYSQFAHRLKVRWHRKADNLYYLQMGTRCDYSYFAAKLNKPVNDGIRVRYHLTSLWQDNSMSGCNQALDEQQKEMLEAQHNPADK